MILYKVLIYLSILSVFFPIVVALRGFSSLSRPFKVLAFLLVLSLVADSLSLLYPKRLHVITNIYSTLQFLLLSVVFLESYKLKLARGIAVFGSIAFLIYLFVDFYLNYNISDRNTHLRVISALWFIVLPLVFYYRTVEKPTTRQLQGDPMFWISTGTLLYFSGNLFLFAANLIVENQNLYQLYIPIHSFFGVSKNLLFAYGLVLAIRN